MTEARETAIRAELESLSQQHVLDFYSDLSAAEQAALLDQIEHLELKTAIEARGMALETEKRAKEGSGEISPFPGDLTVDTPSLSSEARQKHWDAGLNELAHGRVAVVVMAGGQGTRLGSSAPKGLYDIGLPSKTSLFALHAQRIARVSALATAAATATAGAGDTAGDTAGAGDTATATATIPWLVMTSPQTDAETRAYFAEQSHFGLPSENVRFIVQGTLPAFDPSGRVIMAGKGEIATAPNGNGGIYAALHRSGELSRLASAGVRHVLVYSVDNALARVADPETVGAMAANAAQAGGKAVARAGPGEKVGVFALVNNLPSVVEYSEIGAERGSATTESGRLVYEAGNICYHYYSMEFLKSYERADIFHVAHKKIPCIDAAGDPVKPTEPNGIKLETFIFDAFPRAANFTVQLVSRASDFAPVKNAPGANNADSPETAVAAIAALGRKWAEENGAVLGCVPVVVWARLGEN
eukprot:TRINITY_DN794_c1_g1_i3.p1 TRINITY_DN794_c1_g1~~TRINITY_DN794_c1_g1_i3.p1  ORF type:complete len:499 (+),score=157.78 TRINITY_DN794_c1_g1_i3:82-1497(+)